MYVIQGYEFLTFEWVVIAVTFILVVIRLYVRVYLRGDVLSVRSWRWSEVLVILSWLFFLGLGIIDSMANHLDANNINPGFTMPEKDVVLMDKLFFVWTIFYLESLYCSRAAMLLFYNELTPHATHVRTLASIYFTGLVTLVGALLAFFWTVFICRPIELNWNVEAINSGMCYAADIFTNVNWAFLFITDVFIFAIPFPLLRQELKNTSREMRVSVFCLFGLGFINVALVVIWMVLRKEGELNDNVPTEGATQALNLIYIIQMSSALAIPCCPQARMFVIRIGKRFGCSGGRKELKKSSATTTSGDVRELDYIQQESARSDEGALVRRASE